MGLYDDALTPPAEATGESYDPAAQMPAPAPAPTDRPRVVITGGTYDDATQPPPEENLSPPPQPWSALQGELKPYDFGPRDTLKHWLQVPLQAAGMDPYRSEHIAGGLVGAAQLAPPVGIAVAGQEALHDISQGRWKDAAWEIPGLLPGWGAIKRGAQVAEGLYPRVTQNMAGVIPRTGRIDLQGVPSEMELASEAKKDYRVFDNSPVVFDPGAYSDRADIARALASRTANPITAPNTFHILDTIAAPKPAGAIVTPEDIQTALRQLRNGTSNEDRAAGAVAANSFRDFINSPPQGAVIRGTPDEHRQMVEAFNRANANTAAQSRSELLTGKVDVEGNRAQAYGRQNLDERLRGEAFKLRNTPAGEADIRGFTPEERQAVDTIAAGTMPENVARSAGKFMERHPFVTSSIGAGLGGALTHGLDATTMAIGSGLSSGASLGAGWGLRHYAASRAVNAFEDLASQTRQRSPLFLERQLNAGATPNFTPGQLNMRDWIAAQMMRNAAQGGGNAP